ncbi:hypothetical protein K1T71_013373 [Dendrolimus kikuchii]|uniref:Uncharacterized protein n=1 Tax=Dendrolimus kikuchii TaxID=765133 RepID=A0ACC1CIB4_9NEOP|nr:hypothetical protein K1T71_013373 [Dendrolimus kikuchii]
MMLVAPIPSSPVQPYTDVLKEVIRTIPETEVTAVPTQLPLLSDLSQVDRLFITKRLKVKNVLYLRGKKNKYFVKTSDQNLVYTVEEENSWWVGYLCYGLRPLRLRVTNPEGLEIMSMNRPFKCTARVLPCQLQLLEVFSPPGQMIGTVEQVWTAVKPLYVIRNLDGDAVFWIKGPLMTVSCFKDVKFDISRNNGLPVGGTCKRWKGLMHALFFSPVADSFGLAFERDLSVEDKALLLAATLLMDYMYYDV